MLQFIALALDTNREHTKEMPDISVAASRGLMLNLSAVLLKVCEPFADPASGKAWGKLDARSVPFTVPQQVKTHRSEDDDFRVFS